MSPQPLPLRILSGAGSSIYRRLLPKSLRGRLRLKMRLHLFRINLKYRLPWTCYRRISTSDRTQFQPVLDVWRPADDKPLIFITWQITEWCNYKCSYCDQTHDRFARINRGGSQFSAHAFDNHKLDRWTEAFRRHFRDRRLSMKITGGESMIDKKNMVPLIEMLAGLPTLEALRIDTNGTWDPRPYAGVDKSKISLFCSFHPSEVSEDVFWRRIENFKNHGFKVGAVNYVMSHDNFANHEGVREKGMRLGVLVNTSPLWQHYTMPGGYYSEGEIRYLRSELPDPDYGLKLGFDSPNGRKCLYPAVAYFMDQDGQITVGCHRTISGSIFDQSLPRLFAGPVPCPASSCNCLDMYSFLGDLNRNLHGDPLAGYCDHLVDFRKSPEYQNRPRLPLPERGPLLPAELAKITPPRVAPKDSVSL